MAKIFPFLLYWLATDFCLFLLKKGKFEAE